MPNVSAVKLGLLIAWPAFWTGVPFKVALSLLLLAFGLHPWEWPGLAFLLILSIPIDIWALTLAAPTVFLERLRLQAPEGIGLTLWWQAAALSAVYLPIMYVVQTETVAAAKGIAAWLVDFLKELPVAERISLELTLWGGPATIVLVLLLLGWLFAFGKIVGWQASAARPADGPLPRVVRQWDLMRVPRDQPLLLTAFVATGFVLVLMFWGAMPVTTPHPHEDYRQEAVAATAPVKPLEALQKTEQAVAQAEAALQALEEKGPGDGKGEKRKDKSKKESGKPQAAAKPVQAPLAAEKTESHSHGQGTEEHTH